MAQVQKAVAFVAVLLSGVLAACSGQPVTPALTASDTPLANITSTLSANITGPCAVSPNGSGTWDANATGGNGSYTYAWQHRAATSSTWSVVIYSGSTYTRKVGPYANSFYLRVTVTSNGVSTSDDHYVEVGEGSCETID